MIEFDIRTVNNRSLGKVKITQTQRYRKNKRYYDVEYMDKYTTHNARVLQAYEDGALTLITKATKAVEKVRRQFYHFPPELVRWIAKRGDGVVCVSEEEDMSGNKSDSHGLMPVIMPEDIPLRYRDAALKFLSGGAGPSVNGKCGIYLHDFNRWLGKQFVDTV
jgi:hypothetical protein